MSSPLFTQSFLNQTELEHLSRLSDASDDKLRSEGRSNLTRRQHKREIRRRREPVRGSVDPHHTTVSGSFIRPGSASSTTAPRSPREAATPTEPDHGQTTPAGVVPCTPPFPAGSGGGERQSQIHEVKKLEVTVVVNITVNYHPIFYEKVMELIIHQISRKHLTNMWQTHRKRYQAPRSA